MYDATRVKNILSHVTRARSCGRNCSRFDFIYTNKRNRLVYETVIDIVNVHCNLRLLDKIEEIGFNDTNIECSLTFQRFPTATSFFISGKF